MVNRFRRYHSEEVLDKPDRFDSAETNIHIISKSGQSEIKNNKSINIDTDKSFSKRKYQLIIANNRESLKTMQISLGFNH